MFLQLDWSSPVVNSIDWTGFGKLIAWLSFDCFHLFSPQAGFPLQGQPPVPRLQLSPALCSSLLRFPHHTESKSGTSKPARVISSLNHLQVSV